MKERIAAQFKRPSGLLGRMVGFIMRKGNRTIYRLLINRLHIADTDRVLEIGFGTGDAIKIIGAQNCKCQISGINFSELMYKKASLTNKKLIKSGRLSLSFGDFLTHDFAGVVFTKVYCINVVYFWDDLNIGFGKVFNVLKDEGLFGFYMNSSEDMYRSKLTQTDTFNKHSIDYVIMCLENVGFREIQQYYESGNITKGYYIYARKKTVPDIG